MDRVPAFALMHLGWTEANLTPKGLKDVDTAKLAVLPPEIQAVIVTNCRKPRIYEPLVSEQQPEPKTDSKPFAATRRRLPKAYSIRPSRAARRA
ncbi:MAG: hypothetical protein JWM56_492 [Candidatus Peribacteria bacterium]|nr:hypothetical protein [Candidatus Peribacteria bacterium]